MEKDIYKLTPSQVDMFHKYNADRHGWEKDQDQILKNKTKMWEDIYSAHGFDLSRGWKITKTARGLCAVLLGYKE